MLNDLVLLVPGKKKNVSIEDRRISNLRPVVQRIIRKLTNHASSVRQKSLVTRDYILLLLISKETMNRA